MRKEKEKQKKKEIWIWLILWLQQAVWLVHQLQWMTEIMAGTWATMEIVGSTQPMTVDCWWYCLHNWATPLVLMVTKSYKGGTICTMSYGNGTNANGGLQTKEIIWYQVYSGDVNGALAIGYSLFVLSLWKAMGGISSIQLNAVCGLSTANYGVE